MPYEEDTCMSYEEQDTSMSYEEEDTCMSRVPERASFLSDPCAASEEEEDMRRRIHACQGYLRGPRAVRTHVPLRSPGSWR